MRIQIDFLFGFRYEFLEIFILLVYVGNLIFVSVYRATTALNILDNFFAVSGNSLVYTISCECGFDFGNELFGVYVHQITHHKTCECAVASSLDSQIGNHIVQKPTEHVDNLVASLGMFENYHCEGIRCL